MDGAGIKRWESLTTRLQGLQERNWRVEQELSASRAALAQSRQLMARQSQQLAEAQGRIKRLESELAELRLSLKGQASTKQPPEVPAFVKPNVEQKDRKVPGRKIGHEPAHCALPSQIDLHVQVPVPLDRLGKASCPECKTQLSEVHKHQRIVEDLVPSKVIVTCYHTISGYCPGCRKIVESRDSQQPPAPAGVELPQGQLGLNALATAALLRMIYRLPYRQISDVFGELSQLSVSSSAVADQIQRMGRWLEGNYERLRALVRLSPVVHMDETSWRVDGQNHWLWTMLSKKHTVFHVDKSRGNKVAMELLGANFTGTLVSDFYSAYSALECPKQKCLVHLLRELKETSEKHPSFARLPFARRLKRLVQEMLLLKREKAKIDPGVYEHRGRRLERRVLELSREPAGGWTDLQAKRLAKRLKRHGPELTAFLWSAEIDGDNNAAERALRPAVIARKISGGSRSDPGAHATALLLSIFKTAQQQGCPLLETIKTLLTAHWSGKNPAVLTDLFKA